jgi:hypothetical protein
MGIVDSISTREVIINYMPYTKEWIKEYNKTWYWKITLPMGKTPDNWIVGTPIRLFGKAIFIKWKMAKPSYKWNNPIPTN